MSRPAARRRIVPIRLGKVRHRPIFLRGMVEGSGQSGMLMTVVNVVEISLYVVAGMEISSVFRVPTSARTLAVGEAVQSCPLAAPGRRSGPASWWCWGWDWAFTI